jgi:hypothetical protein
MRWAARQDRNQDEIVRAFERLGASVQPIRAIKGGVPDLLVGFRGRNYLVEIKVPKEGRLSESQKEWREAWRGQMPFIIKTIADVILWMNNIS